MRWWTEAPEIETRTRGRMPLYMHRGLGGLTADAVADAHAKDREKQGAHALLADDIVEVREGA